MFLTSAKKRKGTHKFLDEKSKKKIE